MNQISQEYYQLEQQMMFEKVGVISTISKLKVKNANGTEVSLLELTNLQLLGHLQNKKTEPYLKDAICEILKKGYNKAHQKAQYE